MKVNAEIQKHCAGYNNFLFIGEAGSGKSEIALNAAYQLQREQKHTVHFFDMDMTKPLFRSREKREFLEAAGIVFHFEEQFMDAPTLVGGVSRLMRDPECCVVLDVGGDYIGARAVGGFAPLINRDDTMVNYVLNPYRPWSYDIEHIDETLGKILGVSHIRMEKIHLISNPNLGNETTEEDVLLGHQKIQEIVTPYQAIDFVCAKEEFAEDVQEQVKLPVMGLQLYLTYPWTVA